MPLRLPYAPDCVRVRVICHATSQHPAAAAPRVCCCHAKHDTVDRVRTADQVTEDERSVVQGRIVLPAGLTALAALGAAPSHATEVQAAAMQAAAAADAATIIPVDPSTYVPGPVEVGWQIWFAAVVSTVPFVIGAYEFGKRILIQRRCRVCGGSGLVQKGRYPKKCPECGGFFPWISWRMFLSANARPGNGGPLLQPRGQTSVFYSVPPENRPNSLSRQRDSDNQRPEASLKEFPEVAQLQKDAATSERQ